MAYLFLGGGVGIGWPVWFAWFFMALSCRFQATRSNKLNGPGKVELLLEMHQVPRVERWGIFWGKNSWILEEIIATNQSVGYPKYTDAPLRLHVMWHVTHMVNQVIHGEGIFFSYQERGLPSDPSVACDWGNFPWAGWLIGYKTHSSWARSCRSKKRRGLSTWMILVSYIYIYFIAFISPEVFVVACMVEHVWHHSLKSSWWVWAL